MALFFTASSCRHPSTRRRALRLLYRYKRMDSIFDSLGVGILAEHIIMLEEGDREIKTSADVEAAHRVRALNLTHDSGFRTSAAPYVVRGLASRTMLTYPPFRPKLIVNFEQPHADK